MTKEQMITQKSLTHSKCMCLCVHTYTQGMQGRQSIHYWITHRWLYKQSFLSYLHIERQVTLVTFCTQCKTSFCNVLEVQNSVQLEPGNEEHVKTSSATTFIVPVTIHRNCFIRPDRTVYTT